MSWTRDELQLKISNELFGYTQIIDEPAVNEKIAHALHCIAAALLENAKAIDLASWRLGTADAVSIGSPSGTMGGLEFVGAQIKEGAETIANAIADAIMKED